VCPLAIRFVSDNRAKGPWHMIVIGVDPHKKTHTLVAVAEATGEQLGCETVPTSMAGSERALGWARGVGSERVWAIEDCRHVSGRLERWLIARGERIVRVAPKLMAGARQGARTRGKSDPIDALAVARAALREGINRLPGAHLDDRALDIRLLVDHHDDLVADRSDEQRRLRWQLHDLFGELDIPAGALDRDVWLGRIARKLARGEQAVRVRIARELVASIRQRTRRIKALETEIALLVEGYAPQLTAERGCGALTAAKLIGEIAGADRFSSDAKLARAAGVAPVPVSSGRRDRHRLDRGGNRQLNCALHRLAVNKGRWDPDTASYLARKQAEGKTRMEALRCLKRHLARRIHRLLTQPTPTANALDPALALT
jgi:transposase